VRQVTVATPRRRSQTGPSQSDPGEDASPELQVLDGVVVDTYDL
jgi:hypothetical protein